MMRAGALIDQVRQQPPGQQVPGKVIDGEPELVPVPALHPAAVAVACEADAGVVNERSDLRVLGCHAIGQAVDLLQRSEVGAEPVQPPAAGRCGDVVDRPLPAGVVAAVDGAAWRLRLPVPSPARVPGRRLPR